MVSIVQGKLDRYFPVMGGDHVEKEVEVSSAAGTESVRAMGENPAQADDCRKVEIESSKSLRHILHQGLQEIHKEAQRNNFLNRSITGEMDCSKAYVVYLCKLDPSASCVGKGSGEDHRQTRGWLFCICSLTVPANSWKI